MVVRSLMVLAAVLALAACQRERADKEPAPGPTPPGAAVTPADAAAPFGFQDKTPFAEIKLTLPQALKGQPDLHAQIYAREVAALRTFAEGAQADATEAGAPGVAYSQEVELTPAHETGKLLSLKRTAFEFTGGAHPNTTTTGVLWDKAMKRVVGPAELFAKGADLAALDRALCDAVNREKKARVPGAQTVALGGGGMFSCPRLTETPFVLAPGSVGGKAGGLTFLIGPYQVGPYAEGGYEVTLPQSLFRDLFAPAYADEFAGEPVKSAPAA